jgi:hypothetical protein
LKQLLAVLNCVLLSAGFDIAGMSVGYGGSPSLKRPT